MASIPEIHEEIFKYLHDLHEERKKQGKEFHFTLRRTNRYQRLEKGYWFHGNEGYITVSFWSGFDYANKTPNITFHLFPYSGFCSLVFVARDSDLKHEFIKQYLLPLIKDRKGYYENGYSRYGFDFKGEPLETLKKFMETDKVKIDELITEHSATFFREAEDWQILGFIQEANFTPSLNKTLDWRKRRKQKQKQKLIGLRSLDIQQFGPIRNLRLQVPGEWCPMIFLTGENGSGKSSILRVITMGMLGHDRYLSQEKASDPYEFQMLLNHTTEPRKMLRGDKAKDMYGEGFSAYGPYRLQTAERVDEESLVSKIGLGLFEDSTPLLNIDRSLENLKSFDEEDIAILKDSITDTLHDLNDRFSKIYYPGEKVHIEGKKQQFPYSMYEEQDVEGQKYEPVRFDQLASGAKSIVAFCSDIIVRLLQQQPNVEDLAELKGIVIVDEIDLHLHPKMQKHLVEQLHATFPKVQFIISTHSPIPLLGAPPNALIYKVSRSAKTGVSCELLDIDVARLTPNLILSSPIFGFSDLFSTHLGDKANLYSQETYGQLQTENTQLASLINKYKTRKEKGND